MKNVIQKLITMVTLTLISQGCEQLAGMDDASKAKASTEGCIETYGCPWFPEEKSLKWEGCMQTYTQDLSDKGFTCELEERSKDNIITCTYPEGTTQEQIDKEIGPQALALRTELINEYGWYKIDESAKYGVETIKSKQRITLYYSRSISGNGSTYKNGVTTPNPLIISITIADIENINMMDCSK